jgi:hypothetical protein
MIAWDGNNDYKLDLISNTNSSAFSNDVKLIYNLYQPILLVNRVNNNNMSSSDHWYFWQRGYKAYCGIETTGDFNPYYHTVNDNFSHVIFQFFYPFTKAAIASLLTYGWDYFMNYTHTPITNTTSNQPQTATAVINSPHPIAKLSNAPRLYYKINNGIYVYVNAFYNNLDTFKFQIPGQPYGTNVSYYLAAQDSLGRFVGTLPSGGKGLNPPGTIAPPTVFTYSVLTGISGNNEPVKYALEQNYPNPFNASTYIKFTIPKAAYVKLIITSVLGEVIEIPVEGKMHEGENLVRFDANNLGSGIYFYSLYLDGSLAETKKMILVK